MFTVHLGSDPVVVLHRSDVVKEALIDRADEFAARGHMAIGERANNGLGMFADRAPSEKGRLEDVFGRLELECTMHEGGLQGVGGPHVEKGRQSGLSLLASATQTG